MERHFRERGRDVAREPFTLAGVGDMSGDVFGNGLLRSRCARLVAAFDHRHVFIDPDPDAERSFRERERLFALPRSSWADYDPTLISAGGGVFPRSAKSVTLSPEARAALGIDADSLAPAELVSAVLRAPVDLLWFGGIGTYVKSERETHADVGDRANDASRIDARDLRAKVVGEGGNLGMTQLARIDFALAGGGCNTDFIDNSGGVDCSDHEVNIKILLDSTGLEPLDPAARANLLDAMRADVATLVLADNYRQAQSISLASRESARRAAEYRQLMGTLEARGALDRMLEFLPPDELLAERTRRGQGLSRPEIAVLACYAKAQLKQDLLASTFPDDPALEDALASAFPAVLASRYGAAMRAHPLRRDIVATQVCNDLVDRVGPTFVSRLQHALRVDAVPVVRAFCVARDVFDVPAIWQGIESLDNRVPADALLEAQSGVQRLLRVSTRWLLRNRTAVSATRDLLAELRGPVTEVLDSLDRVLRGEQLASWTAQREELRAGGLPETLADAVAGLTMGVAALGIADVAHARGLPVPAVAGIAFALNERLGFHWLGKQLSALPVSGQWEAMARESFLDEVEQQLRAIVSAVAANAVACGADQALGLWEQAHTEAVSRWISLLADLRAASTRDYAMYAVAVRALPELAREVPVADSAEL